MGRHLPTAAWASPAVAAAVAALLLVTGWVYPLLLPLLAALAVCGASGRRAPSVAALLLALVAPMRWVGTPDRAVLLAMLCCATWSVARLAAATRRRSREQVLALVAAGSARAVAEERLRIARDLHDLIAHSMSVITVHAALGAHPGPDQPRRAVDALRVVEDTGRRTLDQLRDLLAVLRTERPGTEPAPLAPAPTLADLPALLAMTRSAGVRLDVCQEGDLESVPAEVGLGLYRILQEGLANALKHGRPGETSLSVVREENAIRLQLSNPVAPGHGSSRSRPAGAAATAGPEGPAGNGLIGIRERVALLDGTVHAGVRSDRYLLTVRLPAPAPHRSGPEEP